MHLKLFTVVHPILADNPWKAPEGWRWAIQTDNRWDLCGQHYEIPGADANNIIAGWQPTQGDAENELSRTLMACRRTMSAIGGTSSVEQTLLVDCPLGPDVLGELAMLG